MGDSYRVVKLLKNHLYPTYQLHAYMANSKTAPQDGIRLAALTTMEWLNRRLGPEAPEEWKSIPAPNNYLTAKNEDLPSLYINQGHVVNIVSLLDQGMWTLQITEPDLGSDPGNPNQVRAAVPGRIIETNIAFRIVDNQVECGFKTVISDPIGTEPEAEVYRIAVVRQLLQNPAFGLKQVTDLPMKPVRLANGAQIKTMLYTAHHVGNQLPCVVFTQLVEKKQSGQALPDAHALPLRVPVVPPLENSFPAKHLPTPFQVSKEESVIVDPPFDLDQFCYYTFSHCRTYILENQAESMFNARTGLKFHSGDVIVIYPTVLGGGAEVISYGASKTKQDEVLHTIELGVKSYLKGRSIDYGKITFLSEAREHLLRLSDDLSESMEEAGTRFKQELERINAVWKSEVSKKEKEIEAISDQLQRQKVYTSRLEDEKTEMREGFSVEREQFDSIIQAQQNTIDFLRRRLDQPGDYDGIQTWVNKYFSDRILLHPKAVTRMLTKSSQCASVGLICDAIDFLATDYWEQRYLRLPKDVALTRCADKYGRPFEISPVGASTIAYTPNEYRIPYFKDERSRVVDSDLDYHLRVGNAPESLLRIYFLHDDEKQLVVIGSLPDHLRAVKIQ